MTLALIAHDSQKIGLAEWVAKNKNKLQPYKLIATKGTAVMIKNITGLAVEAFEHGPDGGDIAIAYQILNNDVDAVIFLVDFKTPQGYEHDIFSLTRIGVIKNIPLALNKATANLLLNNAIENKVLNQKHNKW